MTTRTATRSSANNGRQWWLMAVLVAAVAGLAVGGTVGALLSQPHSNVAAQQARGSTASAFAEDDVLESHLLAEARAFAAGSTVAQSSASTQRAMESLLESHLLTEARLFVPATVTAPMARSGLSVEDFGAPPPSAVK